MSKLIRMTAYVLAGLSAVPVSIEVDILNRLPNLAIAGVPAHGGREIADRVRSAIENAGYTFPKGRVVVNLSPQVNQNVQSLDLPIAVAILAASEQVKGIPEDVTFFGELSLSGDTRPCRGVIAAYQALSKSTHMNGTIVCHPSNANMVASIGGIAQPLSSLSVVDLITQFIQSGKIYNVPPAPKNEAPFRTLDDWNHPRKSEIFNQLIEAARIKRPVLFIGSPGLGKTMLASRLNSLLDEPSFEQKVHALQVADACGLYNYEEIVRVGRPFRAPHHTISLAGINGSNRPGELALSHNGTLFLDEIDSFPETTRDAVKVALTTRKVTLGAPTGWEIVPTDFWLIMAANPCYCGFYGHSTRSCVCTEDSRKRHLKFMDSPILQGALVIDLNT